MAHDSKKNSSLHNSSCVWVRNKQSIHANHAHTLKRIDTLLLCTFIYIIIGTSTYVKGPLLARGDDISAYNSRGIYCLPLCLLGNEFICCGVREINNNNGNEKIKWNKGWDGSRD